LKAKNFLKEPGLQKTWYNLSLRGRLLLPIAAMIVGALLLGLLALQIFSPDQFENENAQQADATRAVAEGLNAALAAAHNPEQILAAFAGGLGTSQAIRYMPPGVATDRSSAMQNSGAPTWFTSRLTIPDLVATYPIKIGSAPAGSIVFAPDLSADVFEKWMGFVAIVASGSALLLLAAISAYLTSGTALRPLAQLGAGLTRMRNGNYATAIPVVGPPEIRKSCQEANQLATTLAGLSRDNRELLRRIVAMQDDERRELARELHDEMGPLLFAVRANAVALSESAADGTPEPGSATHGILEAAEALQRANRHILERLSPIYVAEIGLYESIQTLLRTTQSQARRLRLSSAIDPKLDDLDGLLSQTCYRVIQEGLTNVLRHAHATRMDITATIESGQIAIAISDDGIGLPDGWSFGRGLTGMHERVRALDGILEVLREDGRTVVRCRLPLEHHAGT
jgi:two-component system sensor histidine kinase UhpB